MKRMFLVILTIMAGMMILPTIAHASTNSAPPAHCRLTGNHPHGHTWITVNITHNPCSIHWGARIQCKYFPTHGPTSIKTAYGPTRFHTGTSHVACPANGESTIAIWEGYRYFWQGTWHPVKLV